MPEIPEVEAFKKYIKKHALHKTIDNVESPAKRLIKYETFAQFKKDLIHHSFAQIKRYGKFIVIEISGSKKYLVMHFGLTGYVVYAKNKEKSVKHSCISFIFKDGSILHWNSIRKFGKVWLVKDIKDIKELKNLGKKPLKITKKAFLDLMEKHATKNIKAFLMDQSLLAGIGNEYSDEILFQAGIDPHHSIDELSKKQREKIYSQMQKVLDYAVKLRLKHLDMVEKGFFSQKDRNLFKSSYLQAHRHTDMMCPKNSNHKLKKVKIAGRSTYYCPKEQK